MQEFMTPLLIGAGVAVAAALLLWRREILVWVRDLSSPWHEMVVILAAVVISVSIPLSALVIQLIADWIGEEGDGVVVPHHGFPPADTSLEELIAGEIEKLLSDSGTYRIMAPETVQVGESFAMALEVQKADSILSRAYGATASRRNTSTARLSVPNVLRASVTLDDGSVERVSEPQQVVTRVAPTQWRWNAVVRKEGPQNLVFSLAALMHIRDKTEVWTIANLDREIVGYVPGLQKSISFVKREWKWLVAVLPPAFVWIMRKKWKKRRRIGFVVAGS